MKSDQEEQAWKISLSIRKMKEWKYITELVHRLFKMIAVQFILKQQLSHLLQGVISSKSQRTI